MCLFYIDNRHNRIFAGNDFQLAVEQRRERLRMIRLICYRSCFYLSKKLFLSFSVISLSMLQMSYRYLRRRPWKTKILKDRAKKNNFKHQTICTTKLLINMWQISGCYDIRGLDYSDHSGNTLLGTSFFGRYNTRLFWSPMVNALYHFNNICSNWRGVYIYCCCHEMSLRLWC